MIPKTSLGQFRLIAFIEGISFVVLLFLAMPLKYYFDSPGMVRYVGMIHGFLFIAYVVFLFQLKNEEKWPLKEVVIGLIASIVPFGTFWFDKRLTSRLDY